MRDRLTIGEVAKLTGVTTKTVRHYHKIGLLAEPERSESGYRLYSAEDLLRLHRIRRLQSFGLSLKQIKTVLGDPDTSSTLRKVLEALLSEVSGEMERLQERRGQIEELLGQGDLEAPISPSAKPYAVKLAEEYLGDHLSEVSSELLAQEKELWSTLDAFEWPEGYKEMQVAIVSYYAERPDEYQTMLALEERLVALAEVPEQSPEVERLAQDYARHLEKTHFPGELSQGPLWRSEALSSTFNELLNITLSPAQRRVIEQIQQTLEARDQR